MHSNTSDTTPGRESSTVAASIQQNSGVTYQEPDNVLGEEEDGGLYYNDPDDYIDDEEEDDAGDDEAIDTDTESSSPESVPTPSAGPNQHVVQQGESLISIGRQYNLDPHKILDHQENQHLWDENRETSILNPGDIVNLPERITKTVSGDTEQRHRFVYHGRFTTLRMKFHDTEGPLADEPYLLDVDDQQYQGQLDGEGGLEERIPADAQSAVIRIGPGGDHVMNIGVGYLNPISEVTGIQMRLNNLGYACGNEDGKVGTVTQAAIRRFQADHDLEETDQIDDPTRDQLRQAFGS